MQLGPDTTIQTVRELLGNLQRLALSPDAPPAVATVADLLRTAVARRAEICSTGDPHAGQKTLHLRIGGDPPEPEVTRWMSARFEPGGDGLLSASHPSFLFALAVMLLEEWLDESVTPFVAGRTIVPRLPWLRNLSDFVVGSLRFSKGFRREDYFAELARLGFTHVSINGLGVPRPYESGPPGDRYFWFYDYSPDLDQFVSSRLLAGYYPPDYLRANLATLEQSAVLARRYGLVPGLHINSPRSMPEEFWARYGFLRGARIDHPRETFRPRYTLAMAHPAVQEHYRELMRGVLRVVPDLGFIHVWTNDSGSGFEFVSSLYAGRNGGPYLLREWKDNDEIARTAAENVLTYYTLLRDEARAVNPSFRLVCDLGPFYAERKFLIPHLGDGIDAGEFAFFERPTTPEDEKALAAGGAWRHLKLDLTDTNVLGVPFPWLVCERLSGAVETGAALAGAVPRSLAPYDVNGEVVRWVQFGAGGKIDERLLQVASSWVSDRFAPQLVELWALSDLAVRGFPAGIPMSTFGFPWFRLWVRPLVPDIGAIPEPERAYYEDFLLATFNNPARVDLNNDMMWNFLTPEQAGDRRRAIERDVLPPLAEALARCGKVLRRQRISRDARAVFADLRDRLIAARCYYTTMKNTMAWTESVHGYLQAKTPDDQAAARSLCRAMMLSELDSARTLLELWRKSGVMFLPVSRFGETLHSYGENFGELLEKKIGLMERHIDDVPHIDPDYMWRMPS
jgi:hypothetical protein